MIACRGDILEGRRVSFLRSSDQKRKESEGGSSLGDEQREEATTEVSSSGANRSLYRERSCFRGDTQKDAGLLPRLAKRKKLFHSPPSLFHLNSILHTPTVPHTAQIIL